MWEAKAGLYRGEVFGEYFVCLPCFLARKYGKIPHNARGVFARIFIYDQVKIQSHKSLVTTQDSASRVEVLRE